MWNWVKKNQCEYFFSHFLWVSQRKVKKNILLKNTTRKRKSVCGTKWIFVFHGEKKVEKILKKIKYICVELSKSRAECIFFLWHVIKMLYLLNCIFIRKKKFLFKTKWKKFVLKKSKSEKRSSEFFSENIHFFVMKFHFCDFFSLRLMKTNLILHLHAGVLVHWH